MKNKLMLKILSIVMFMAIGTSSMVYAVPSAFSGTHGHQKIQEIRARNRSSRPMGVDELIKHSHEKNNVTQTEIQVKNVEKSKKSVVATEMIVADARYFNIYDSTGENKKVVGQLDAYKKVKILKSVDDYYKIDKGFIKKKAVLTEKEYKEYTKKREGDFCTTMDKPSNADLSDIKKMVANYPRVKGMELTFLICEKEYGINAIIMIACAVNESHLGESHIGKAKNNMFGIAAYDWDPFNCAKKFDTLADCLDYWCNLITKNYFAKGMNTPTKMKTTYCTDGHWDRNIEQISAMLIRYANK